jgi:hypothetical protein
MRWLNRLTARTIAVHLTDDESIRGVVAGVYRDCVVLKHAAYLSPNGSIDKLDGETVIPRERIGWIQTLKPDEVG